MIFRSPLCHHDHVKDDDDDDDVNVKDDDDDDVNVKDDVEDDDVENDVDVISFEMLRKCFSKCNSIKCKYWWWKAKHRKSNVICSTEMFQPVITWNNINAMNLMYSWCNIYSTKNKLIEMLSALKQLKTTKTT